MFIEEFLSNTYHTHPHTIALLGISGRNTVRAIELYANDRVEEQQAATAAAPQDLDAVRMMRIARIPFIILGPYHYHI